MTVYKTKKTKSEKKFEMVREEKVLYDLWLNLNFDITTDAEIFVV